MASRKRSGNRKSSRPRPPTGPPSSARGRGPAPVSFRQALAPATEHLFRAAGELIAAASAAVEAIPKPGERARSVARTGKAALEVVSGLMRRGADRARARAKDTVRKQALEEILDGLDRRASRLSGPAAAAMAVVRDAVAGAAHAVGVTASHPAPPARPAPAHRAPSVEAPLPASKSGRRATARRAIERELSRVDLSGSDDHEEPPPADSVGAAAAQDSGKDSEE